jgi:hypothetical protein
MTDAKKAMIELCESPAETAFVDGMFDWATEYEIDVRILKPGMFGFFDRANHWLHYVQPQAEIEILNPFAFGTMWKYRLDFYFIPRPMNKSRAWNGYAVEIDGHKWHERTAEDAAYQRQRDRTLMFHQRILTIRYAAIEVFRDASSVMYELECLISASNEADALFALESRMGCDQ